MRRNKEITEVIRDLLACLPNPKNASSLQIGKDGKAFYEAAGDRSELVELRQRAESLLDELTRPYDGVRCPSCTATARHPMYQGDLYCFNCGRIFPAKE